jgi:hypothetical protein
MQSNARKQAERILTAAADYVERECGKDAPSDKLADVINHAGRIANDLLYDERERATLQRKGAGFAT